MTGSNFQSVPYTINNQCSVLGISTLVSPAVHDPKYGTYRARQKAGLASASIIVLRVRDVVPLARAPGHIKNSECSRAVVS